MIEPQQILAPAGWPARTDAVVWQLRCPACGDGTVERSGGDDAAVTVSPDRDAYDSPIGSRGGFVRIKLFCSSGHGFDLIIANHKGSEYLGIVNAGPRDYES